MTTGQLIDGGSDYCNSITIEEEDDQKPFHVFIYCASALRTYPLSLPYCHDDLGETHDFNKPECHYCDFRDTFLWEEQSNNKVIIKN
jgi:hypothetical protein